MGRDHVVIIGNGISGITAARHIRKLSKKKITVISSESDYFFARTALMYVYMGHLRWKDIQPYEDWFWEENDIALKKDYVKEIDVAAQELLLASGERISYNQLIIATGAAPRKLHCEGEDSKGVQALVSKQDLELLEENTRHCRRAIIVGGGLIGVELAEMLHTRNIDVNMLIREASFWGSALPEKDAKFISEHIKSHGVSLTFNTEVGKINSDETGKVISVVTKDDREIGCDLVALAIGVTPNISFLKGSAIETDRGVLVSRKLQTNIKNIFAIGDCAQQREPTANRNAVEAVWYTARMMGETVAQTICGNSFEYNPGNWFNSAKFFEIEYQTYGRVQAAPKENEIHLHWEHSDKTKAITIAFNSENHRFLGINTFGIRMRQAVFDRWLTEKKSIEFVLSHLKKANFDPEFYNKHEKEILKSFESSLNLI